MILLSFERSINGYRKIMVGNRGMAKFCPTCGKTLQFENAEICPSCGVRIKEVPEVPPIQSVRVGKSTGLAVILSFFIPGLGQIYCGRIMRGILILIGIIFSCILAFGLFISLLGSSHGDPSAGFTLLIPPIFWVLNLYDAYTIAKQTER